MSFKPFNTEKDMLEFYRKEAEKIKPMSGILCNCNCYRWEPQDIRQVSPLQHCLVILPPDRYKQYETETREEDKWYNSRKEVVVIHPGYIRVRRQQKEKDNYCTDVYICKNKISLDKFVGKKIRLGKNLLVK
jgi:hypothetical protein